MEEVEAQREQVGEEKGWADSPYRETRKKRMEMPNSHKNIEEGEECIGRISYDHYIGTRREKSSQILRLCGEASMNSTISPNGRCRKTDDV